MAGKAVVINGSTGTGSSVSFTSSGFGTPTGAIILWSAATSSNADTAHARNAITLWAGSNTGSVYAITQDNKATTVTNRGIYDSVIANLPNSSGTADFVGSISTTTDGITITFSDTPAADYKVTIVLFGGDAVCSVGAVDIGQVGNGGSYTYTNAAESPDVVFFVSSNSTGINTTSSSAYFMFGMAVNDGSMTQRTVTWSEAYNSGASAITIVVKKNALFTEPNLTDYLSLTAFTSTGFTLTGTNTTNTTAIILTVSGLTGVSLDDTAMPSSTGTTSWTGPGFEPDLLFNVQTGVPAYNANDWSQDLNLTMGCTDGITTGGVADYALDGAVTTDTANRHNTTLGTTNQTAADEQWNFTLDSFDSDGYNFAYTEVGTSGDIGFTLAIQFESSLTPITGYWAMDGVIEA